MTPNEELIEQGLKLHQQGNWLAACRCFDEVLAKEPNNVAALRLLGVAMVDGGVVTQGIVKLEAALKLDPKSRETLLALSLSMIVAGKHEEAVARMEEAVALDPTNPWLHWHLGNVLAVVRQPERALGAYDHAIELKADFAEAFNKRGELLEAIGREEEALMAYKEALKIQPENEELNFIAGRVCQYLEDWEQALSFHGNCVKLQPKNPRALNHQGISLSTLGRVDEALELYRKALEIQPDHPATLTNMGSALRLLGRFDESVQMHESALRIQPDNFRVIANLGNTLLSMNSVDMALQCYENALSRSPENRELAYNVALARLALGDFERGWTFFDTRVSLRSTEPGNKYWDGSAPKDGKNSMLVMTDQGLGDGIQFVRYLPHLAKMGFRVSVLTQSALKPLLDHQKGVDAVYGPKDTLPSFDVYTSILSLPKLLKSVLGVTIPAEVPYLDVPIDRKATADILLGGVKRPAVGLVWAGNPNHQNDKNRSMALAQLADVLAVKGVSFYALQGLRTPQDHEAVKAYPQIRDLSTDTENLADTAALIQQLDLVISVDTSAVHLAGALGKPVWVLLPFAADWRWQLNRTDSPWYPTAKLYRQAAFGDWSAPLAQLVKDLEALAQAK